MRSGGLRARPRKPFRPKTTRPDHAAHPSPNLLAKAQAPTAPGTHLVSDICQRPPALPCGLPAAGYLAPLGSYIPTREGWLYLAVVLDLFSRSILGWKLSDSLHTGVVTGSVPLTPTSSPPTPSSTPIAVANTPPPPPARSSPATACAKA